MTGIIAALQAEIGGTIYDDHGDKRLSVGGGQVYCAPITGKVRAEVGGHVHTLGECGDGAEKLAAAYRAVTA